METEHISLKKELTPLENQLKLDISLDAMRAVLKVTFPLKKVLTFEEVAHVLSANGIKNGFDQSKTSQHIEEINHYSGEQNYYQFEVASGTPCKPSKNGRIELLVKDAPRVTLDKEGRADFRNISKYKNVKKGAVLARHIPPKPGEDGSDIRGRLVKPAKPKDVFLVCEENIKFIEKTGEYLAEEDGIFFRDGINVSVSPILYIHGNAGIKSGNIVYDRSVHIMGNVERGVLVSCAGDLQIDGFVESSSVRVGGSLHVGQGVNTASQSMDIEHFEGVVYVKDDVSCVHLDNTNMIVSRHAFVEHSIHASHLIIHGDLTMGAYRSVIVGGELMVYGSITANRIGNTNGMKTKIILGTHHINKKFDKFYTQEILNMEKKYEILHRKILGYKRYLTKSGKITDTIKEEIELNHIEYRRIDKILKSLREAQSKYKKGSENSQKISITVRDTIFPGVEIYYQNHKKTIPNAISAVVFHFEPGQTEPKLSVYSP